MYLEIGAKRMTMFEYLPKVLELVTPEFTRKIHQKRFDRLENFFETRKKIESSTDYSDVEKKILLNSAVSALTGAAFSNIEEFDFFRANFDPNNFENDYFAFARNRITYEMIEDQFGVKKIVIIKKQLWLMNFLHWFIGIVFTIVPMAILYKFNEILSSFEKDLKVAPSFTSIAIWIVLGVCLLTVVKIMYEWSCWRDLNKTINKKFPN